MGSGARAVAMQLCGRKPKRVCSAMVWYNARLRAWNHATKPQCDA